MLIEDDFIEDEDDFIEDEPNYAKDQLTIKENGMYQSEHDCLRKLIGAKILNIGFVLDCEGGFTIEYTHGVTTERLVLGSNDLGTWIKFHGRVDED